MGYVACKPWYEKKAKFKVGDWVIARRKLKAEAGYFEKGTKVKVVGIGIHGYNLEDEYGNRLIDCGFHSVKREE